jgi:hypothetical protein
MAPPLFIEQDMKKALIISISIFLLFSFGCKQKFRVNSIAMIDRSPYKNFAMEEIADTFRSHSVKVVDKDSIMKVLDEKDMKIRTGLLCAAYRQERLNSAVRIGKELGVDAVVFSSMPPTGVKTISPPCPSESLISFFLVDPPKVLFESRTYETFIYNLSSINWEVVASPPPKPETFITAIDNEIRYAGLRIRVVRNENIQTPIEETPPAPISGFEDIDFSQAGIEPQQASREKEPALNSQVEAKTEKNVSNEKVEKTTGLPWLFAVEDAFHLIYSEPFETRITGKIAGKLEYDVSSIGIDEDPSFKMVLTDIRVK